MPSRPRVASDVGLVPISKPQPLLDDPAKRCLLRKPMSDSLLYTHYLPNSSSGSHASSEDSLPGRQNVHMPDIRIIEWMDRQGDTITNPALIYPPPVIDLRSFRRPGPATSSAGSSSREPATPATGAYRSSGSARHDRRRAHIVQNRPHELQGIGRFLDEPGVGFPRRRLHRRHRPLTGWFNLWL